MHRERQTNWQMELIWWRSTFCMSSGGPGVPDRSFLLLGLKNVCQQDVNPAGLSRDLFWEARKCNPKNILNPLPCHPLHRHTSLSLICQFSHWKLDFFRNSFHNQHTCVTLLNLVQSSTSSQEVSLKHQSVGLIKSQCFLFVCFPSDWSVWMLIKVSIGGSIDREVEVNRAERSDQSIGQMLISMNRKTNKWSHILIPIALEGWFSLSHHFCAWW